MSKPHDLFISYASEDEEYATKLNSALSYFGLSVWFAPLSLRIGDKLLDSVNAGLIASKFGLLILSPAYIAKQWTSYELSMLHRQHIEDGKKLFPILHGVEKSEIDQWNPGLSGIIAMRSSDGLSSISQNIADIVYQGCPTRGISPVYENPQWRFLQGCGELVMNHEGGGVFNLFEAAEFSEEKFPIYVHKRPHTRKEIVLAVAKALYYKNPDVISLTPEDLCRITTLCKRFGYDIEAPEFDPALYG